MEALNAESILYLLLLFGPHNALIFGCYRTHALVHELLHSLSAVRLSRENIALGIRGDAVNRIELPRLAPAVAEAGDDFESLAQHDVDLLIGAVGQEDVLLLGVRSEERRVGKGVGDGG